MRRAHAIAARQRKATRICVSVSVRLAEKKRVVLFVRARFYYSWLQASACVYASACSALCTNVIRVFSSRETALGHTHIKCTLCAVLLLQAEPSRVLSARERCIYAITNYTSAFAFAFTFLAR